MNKKIYLSLTFLFGLTTIALGTSAPESIKYLFNNTESTINTNISSEPSSRVGLENGNYVLNYTNVAGAYPQACTAENGIVVYYNGSTLCGGGACIQLNLNANPCASNGVESWNSCSATNNSVTAHVNIAASGINVCTATLNITPQN